MRLPWPITITSNLRPRHLGANEQGQSRIEWGVLHPRTQLCLGCAITYSREVLDGSRLWATPIEAELRPDVCSSERLRLTGPAFAGTKPKTFMLTFTGEMLMKYGERRMQDGEVGCRRLPAEHSRLTARQSTTSCSSSSARRQTQAPWSTVIRGACAAWRRHPRHSSPRPGV